VSATDVRTVSAQPLNRTTHAGRPPADPRLVHLGLGAFHRAHQAWYTARAGGWGIVAFTGRSPQAAEDLAAQDGLYTLIERGAEGDRFEVLDAIVEAHDAGDLATLEDLLAQPNTAVVTLTITEAGYHVRQTPDGPVLDLDDPQVAADLERLRSCTDEDRVDVDAVVRAGGLRTAAARLVAGLAARRAGDGWPLAIVSCDNLSGNGAVARAAVAGLAEALDPALAAWIGEKVSFVDTSIDRITPRTTDADRDLVAEATGFHDASPVVTEPFTSWVLSGDFPAGRPDWEQAGAQFVADLEPFERRKLWLLNGAHSLMAYLGMLRGHETVAEALADRHVSEAVEALWDADERQLTDPQLDIPGYRRSLRERFENPRIAHRLAQISQDGSVKLAERVVPVLRAERDADRDGHALLVPLAAWADLAAARHRAGEDLADAQADRMAAALEPAADAGSEATETTDDSSADAVAAETARLLAVIDPQLAEDEAIVAGVAALRGA
jgi:fructuronate reductase